MQTPARSLWILLFTAALGLASGASAISIDWVTVGDPNNSCDLQAQGCFGSVAEEFRISKHEITNAQYTEFLNAKAGASDPLALYSANMDPSAGLNGGITQSGANYSAVGGRENLPVNHVTFYDALRFANWLNNGQGAGDTESGAYLLLGGTPEPAGGFAIARNAGASVFLPSENEWYKAAYYDALSTSYFDYTAGTDVQTACTGPGATANTANCDWPIGGGPGDLTDVGSYTNSASPNGTFDQGGNVWEWTEALTGAANNRVVRGGSFLSIPESLASATQSGGNPVDDFNSVGFRVGAVIPEPGTGLLMMAGMLGMAAWRRRRA